MSRRREVATRCINIKLGLLLPGGATGAGRQGPGNRPRWERAGWVVQRNARSLTAPLMGLAVTRITATGDRSS